jgi:hypothetical protein
VDPNAVAGMVFTLILATLVGGFILLYPLARRAAHLLDSKVQGDREPQAVSGPDVRMLTERVEVLESELSRLRERQDFTEGLTLSKGAQASEAARTLSRPAGPSST